MSTEKNILDLEKSFFVIDSKHLEDVSSAFYGFCIVDDTVINNLAGLLGRNPEGNGAYVYVKTEHDEIRITQDFIGAFGLYLYEHDDFFAISNSFTYLAEYLKGKYPLTLNRDYANMFVMCDLCSFVMEETLFQEIRMLNRNVTVIIDRNTGKLHIEEFDWEENTIELDSPQGIALVDNWMERWKRIIRNLADQTSNIQTDLSGGFDSRLVFCLMLTSGIDLSKILINSLADDRHTHSEDFRIATMISEHYGTVLNNKTLMSYGNNPFSPVDSLNLSMYVKNGFTKQLYLKYGVRQSLQFSVGGAAGECLRSYWTETIEEYLHKNYLRAQRYGQEVAPMMQRSITRLTESSLQRIRDKYTRLGRHIEEDQLLHALYRETRCRNHFGKDMVENCNVGVFKIFPLMDPDLHKLKLASKECDDPNLLVSVIFDRFQPELLNFPFDSSRSIAPETIEYARRLNKQYPYYADDAVINTSHCSIILPLQDQNPVNPRLDRNGLLKQVRKAFESDTIRDSLEEYFSRVSYRYSLMDSQSREHMPMSEVYSSIAVGWAISISERNNNSTGSAGKWVLDLTDSKPRERNVDLRYSTEADNLFTVRLAVTCPQDEGEFTVRPVDGDMIILPYQQDCEKGWLVKSSTGKLVLSIHTDRSLTCKFRLSSPDNRNAEGKRCDLPLDICKVIFDDKVILENRRTVYGVKPFIFQSEIDPEKDSILTVAWSPYGLGEDALANDGNHLNKLIQKVALMDEEIRNKDENIRTLNSQLDKIQNSHSYRIGLAVTYVPKLIRDFFKRLLNK